MYIYIYIYIYIYFCKLKIIAYNENCHENYFLFLNWIFLKQHITSNFISFLCSFCCCFGMQCETTLIWLEEIWSLLLICVPMETCFVHVSLHVFSFQGRMTIDMELHLPKTAKILPKSNPLVHYDVFLYKVAKSPVHSRVKHRVRWEDCKYCVYESPFYRPISTRSLPAIIHRRTSQGHAMHSEQRLSPALGVML